MSCPSGIILLGERSIVGSTDGKGLATRPSQMNPVLLKGGNWNFTISSTYSLPADCAQGPFGFRCGSGPQQSLHFDSGLVHLDSANPNSGLLGIFLHGSRDGLGGNTVNAGGIPR
jgi:hypothetical protein